MNHIYLEKQVPPEWDGRRLDQALAGLCPEYSRSQIKNWILAGAVTLRECSELKPNTRVYVGDPIHLEMDLPNQSEHEAQEVPLRIIYEDQDILIIDKPAGLVVHPGAGHHEKTLMNGLLHYDPKLAKVPRAGIVHRLDKDTTGLLVAARHISAHNQLVKSLKERQIKREYIAIAHGLLQTNGVINAPLARHPRFRTKMAVTSSGKPALTRYQVLQRFRAHTYLRIELETGRTHQIRVHFAHIDHPLVGDSQYAGRRYASAPPSFHRQALHAIQLTLTHPGSGERLSWISPIPEDLQGLLLKLQEESLNETS